MAGNVEQDIKYYLVVPNQLGHLLGHIRLWENIKIASHQDELWLTGFTIQDIESTIIKSIPEKKIYYGKDNYLFNIGGILRQGIVPSLLWSPISKFINIKLPDFNHNFFGLEDSLRLEFISDDQEKESSAIITPSLSVLDFVKTCSNERLKKIKYAQLSPNISLLIGKPILPLNGETFWLSSSTSLFPAGYIAKSNFLFQALEVSLKEKHGKGLFLWWTNGNYNYISEELLVPLTRSSIRRTLSQTI